MPDKKDYFKTVDRAEERISSEVNQTYLITRQMDRINHLISIGHPAFSNAVDGLEALLYPYLDKDFEDKVEDAHEKLMEKVKKLAKGKTTTSQENINNAIQTKAKIKYKLLIELMERKYFFPLKDMQYSDDKETKEILERLDKESPNWTKTKKVQKDGTDATTHNQDTPTDTRNS